MPDPTTYVVRSAITGARTCGPYDDLADAERERDRLNLEAATGVRKKAAHKGEPEAERAINYEQRYLCNGCGRPPQPNPQGELACPSCKAALVVDNVLNEAAFREADKVAKPILQEGIIMQYEIVSGAGVVV